MRARSGILNILKTRIGLMYLSGPITGQCLLGQDDNLPLNTSYKLEALSSSPYPLKPRKPETGVFAALHRGNIQWDEDNLRQIEAEKPVRTRISEPKTPFYPEIEEDACHCSGNTSYAAHAEAVQNALNEMLLRQHCHCEDTKSLEDGAHALTLDEDAVKDRSGLSFQEQRKVHYNEFQKMRELSGKDFLLDVAVDEDNSVSSGLKAMHTEEGTEDTLQLN